MAGLCILVAIGISWLSIHDLPRELQQNAIATAIIVPLLTAPPSIAYVTRQDLKSLKHMQEVTRLALTDDMTGLPNRRAFMQNAKEQLIHHEHTKTLLAVLLIDLDYFKRVNDTFGHEAGDIALVHVAHQMSHSLAQPAFIARLGGEEFVALIEADGVHEIDAVSDALRQAIAATPIKIGGHTIQITASIGVSTARQKDSVSSILSRADKALYEAKNHGRNRVSLAA